MSVDPRTVFVVHGRNAQAREGMFDFLRALDLNPMEWSQAISLTGQGAPFIGEVLEKAFSAAQAVVVLLTPDEITYLRHEYAHENDPETEPAPQARPNVLFEAGMAFGRHPERTILVELGKVRLFSDVAGRHALRLDGGAESRRELAQRLKDADCAVNDSGSDWLTAGELVVPPPPGNGLPLGKRLPEARSGGVRVTARFVNRGNSGSCLQVTNHSELAIHNLVIEVPEEAGTSFRLVESESPIKKLPAGETASYIAFRTSGCGANHFEIRIIGETDEGEPIETTAFVNLLG